MWNLIQNLIQNQSRTSKFNQESRKHHKTQLSSQLFSDFITLVLFLSRFASNDPVYDLLASMGATHAHSISLRNKSNFSFFLFSPLHSTQSNAPAIKFSIILGERQNEEKIGKSIVKRSFFPCSNKSIRKRIRVKELIVSTLHSLCFPPLHILAWYAKRQANCNNLKSAPIPFNDVTDGSWGSIWIMQIARSLLRDMSIKLRPPVGELFVSAEGK